MHTRTIALLLATAAIVAVLLVYDGLVTPTTRKTAVCSGGPVPSVDLMKMTTAPDGSPVCVKP